MDWQIPPPHEIEDQVSDIGASKIKPLLGEIMGWMEAGEQEDLAMSRALIDRGYSEDLSWWLIKEARMREVDVAQS